MFLWKCDPYEIISLNTLYDVEPVLLNTKNVSNSVAMKLQIFSSESKREFNLYKELLMVGNKLLAV